MNDIRSIRGGYGDIPQLLKGGFDGICICYIAFALSFEIVSKCSHDIEFLAFVIKQGNVFHINFKISQIINLYVNIYIEWARHLMIGCL